VKLKDLAAARFAQLVQRFEQELKLLNKRLIYFGDKTLSFSPSQNTSEDQQDRFEEELMAQEAVPANREYLASVKANPTFDDRDFWNPDARGGAERIGGAFDFDEACYVSADQYEAYKDTVLQYKATVQQRRKLLHSLASAKHAIELAHEHFGDD